MHKPYAIQTFVPEAVYTDRTDYIDYFYNAALNAIRRRTMSTVLLGQRRMGKTEIFKRAVNRLFFEQDRNNPQAAVPVYYQFPDEAFTKKDFALDYTVNFIRWCAAFYTGDTGLLAKPGGIHALLDLVEKQLEISNGFSIALDLAKAILDDDCVLPEKLAINLPRMAAAADDSTIVMFLDEFQNTRLPHRNFSITGFFQEAVESPSCPHFVTGSAMSILGDEILGKGALYGRFDYERIQAFTGYWGQELACRSSSYYNVELPVVLAPVVSDRCGGNPFYINAVIRQASKCNKAIKDEETLNKILAIDITSGFIWAELSDQVNRWIERVNEHGITKWILYLAAMETGDEIDLQRIKDALYDYEKTDLPISKIKYILIKLARGDLLEYKSFGNWFSKINDPILNEFLKVWGQIEVERQDHVYIEKQTVRNFKKFQKRFYDYKGYLAEIYMIQVLWNSQGRTLPGALFHNREDIVMPDRFYHIDQRHRPGIGKKMEIDIYADAADEIWLAESKWWTDTPVGRDVVENILQQADILKKREKNYQSRIRLWIFAYNGVTKPARALMDKHGILWSSRTELDDLLETLKLRKLPVLEEDLK